MGDRLVVNFAALQQAVADITNGINSMNQQLEDVETAAKPLVEAWEGGAQEAYQQRQQKWRSAASDLTTMLTQIKSAVEESASEYQQTEQRNTQLFA